MRATPPLPDSRPAVTAENGFTRLEAVIVVAVTMLVAAVGISAVRTYLVRAEITESIALAKFAQDQVTRAFRRTGTPPADRAGAGLGNNGPDTTARFLAETRVTDGRIDLVFGTEAAGALEGHTLSLTPFETADRQVVWVCGYKAPGVGLQPLGFADGGTSAIQAATTVEPRYLPRACR